MSQLRSKFEMTFTVLTLQIPKNPVCPPKNQNKDFKKFGLGTALLPNSIFLSFTDSFSQG